MMRILSGFACGLVFGLGLVLSGMSNPAKVLSFLDILGAWDASLMFVLGGASFTAFIGYRLTWRREHPVLMSEFDLPKRSDIDWPLVIGASAFGVGWGIGGFCPGPAWTALPLASPGALVFLPAMIFGMWLGDRVGRMKLPGTTREGASA